MNGRRPPQARLCRASSPKGTPYGNAGNFIATAKSRPLGEGGIAVGDDGRGIRRSAALSQKAALQMPFPATTPPVKMRLERSAELVGAKPLHLLTQTALPLKSPTGAFIAAQTRSLQTRNKNNSSAEDGQSATTTTAASGGNREELLGQRPARRTCRPRHDADAGCRNPIAERIPNRSLRTAAASDTTPPRHG